MLATDRVHLLDKWSRNYFPFSMEGVVLYLPLWEEDMQGTPLISYDPNHASCAVVGATKGTQGFILDGADDHIVLPANWLPSTGTISLWFEVNNAAANAYIISSDANEIAIYYNGNLIVFYYNSASTGNSAALGLVNDTFINLTVTYGLNLNSIYYKNGAVIAGGGACGAVAPTNVATWLGEGTGGTLDMAGTFAEAAIWNRVLSADEVKHYYNNSYPRRFV